jgi:hypothetical protein
MSGYRGMQQCRHEQNLEMALLYSLRHIREMRAVLSANKRDRLRVHGGKAQNIPGKWN